MTTVLHLLYGTIGEWIDNVLVDESTIYIY